MASYTVRRILLSIPVLLGVSFIVFLLIHLVPGDPVRVMLGVHADPEQVARIRETMGFNDPLLIQYARWLWNGLHGNLGESYITGAPVMGSILQRWAATVTLAATGLVISLALALTLGVVSALRPRSKTSFFTLGFTQIGVATPPFWLGIMFVLFWADYLRWLPASGYATPADGIGAWLAHLVLPAVTIAVSNAAVLTRYVRSSMIEALGQPYIQTARAKGVAERLVLLQHALRNALIPTVTMAGMQLAWMLGGTVVVEMVFAWPGLGRLTFDAIVRRDYPMVQGAVLSLAVTFVMINLLVDLLYSYLDPRIKVK